MFLEKAWLGDSEELHELLDDDPVGLDVNYPGEYSTSPLYAASLEGHVRCVQTLCNHPDVDLHLPNDYNGDGLHAIHGAALSGHTRVVRLLLSRGADVNALDRNGHTPLHKASAEGHEKTVGLLLKNGADPKAVTSAGWTALHKAGYHGHARLVPLLVTVCGINTLTVQGASAVYLAADQGHFPVVSALLNAGADTTLTRKSDIGDVIGWER